MTTRLFWKTACLVALTLLPVAAGSTGPADAQDTPAQSAGGLTVHLGVTPAAALKRPDPHSAERVMHGGIPRGRHTVHVVAAIFDARTNERITDATVMLQVSGLGLFGPTITLEPMQIGGVATFGAFATLPGADLYALKLTVERAGTMEPVTFNFRNEHRRLR